VSYQREDERYWTDYLRVALPIVGLLLLVGLLWFWLASIIGDDDSNEPTATPNVGTTVIAAETPTATATSLTVLNPTTGPGPTATGNGENPPPTNTPVPGEEPTEPPAEEARFQADEIVIVISDNSDLVNLRASASIEAEVITQLEPGTELTITGQSEEADEFTWWPVLAEDGTEGYVADDFLEPAPEE
jgi:hypothetical protein